MIGRGTQTHQPFPLKYPVHRKASLFCGPSGGLYRYGGVALRSPLFLCGNLKGIFKSSLCVFLSLPRCLSLSMIRNVQNQIQKSYSSVSNVRLTNNVNIFSLYKDSLKRMKSFTSNPLIFAKRYRDYYNISHQYHYQSIPFISASSKYKKNFLSFSSFPRAKIPLLQAQVSQKRLYSQYRYSGSGRGGGINSVLNKFSPEQVIYTIIGINGAICIYWNTINTRSADRWMKENFTITPFLVSKGVTLHTLFTSFFAHRDYMHCFLNMLTLYFFGIEAAAYMGVKRFLQLYLGGGFISSLGVAIWPTIAPYFNLRGNAFEKTLGASGAVNSIIMYSIILNPTATIYVYMILPLPAALLGVMFLAKDFMGLIDGTSSVSHTAHLAGAAYGALFYLITRGKGGGGGRGFYQRWR